MKPFCLFQLQDCQIFNQPSCLFRRLYGVQPSAALNKHVSQSFFVDLKFWWRWLWRRVVWQKAADVLQERTACIATVEGVSSLIGPLFDLLDEALRFSETSSVDLTSVHTTLDSSRWYTSWLNCAAFSDGISSFLCVTVLCCVYTVWPHAWHARKNDLRVFPRVSHLLNWVSPAQELTSRNGCWDTEKDD
jgi:hypothetical protein